MPIMAAHGQNDARVAARLLANTAMDCLRHPEGASQWQVALNNVYRLLESFRSNPFFGQEAPLPHTTHEAPETLALVPPAERHARDVRVAIERALEQAFPDEPRDQAIREVEKVLQGVAYPQKFEGPTQNDLERATHFFEALLRNLKFA